MDIRGASRFLMKLAMIFESPLSQHLPFPLFFAYAAGFSELIGSWLVILGLLTPIGALALRGTMTVAAVSTRCRLGSDILGFIPAAFGALRSRHPSAPAEHASAERSARDPCLFSRS